MTSLSAGIAIKHLLTEAQLPVTDVFPVYLPTAMLPYVYYERTSLTGVSVKDQRGSEGVTVELNVCAETYGESITLAERVREILDGATYRDEDIHMRRCALVDASESFNGDAYVQTLIFTLKID